MAGEARLLGLTAIADFSRELCDLFRNDADDRRVARGIELLEDWLGLELDDLLDGPSARDRLNHCRDALSLESAVEVEPTAHAHASTADRHPTVLLVDDSPLVRMVLEAQLARAGFEVQTVADADRALELVADHRPGVVLTDLAMPGMGGFELLRRLRDIAPELPVIVISGEDSAPDRARARSLGATDYVIKTQDAGPLVTALQRAVSA